MAQWWSQISTLSHQMSCSEHVNTDEAEASPPAPFHANQCTALALCRVFRKPGYSPLGSTVYT